MIGFGLYLFDKVSFGEKIVYKCNLSYWVNDLFSMCGFVNYDCIMINYYFQDQMFFEVFKKGDVDFYLDGSFIYWCDFYDFLVVCNGDVVWEEFKLKLLFGMFGFVFNMC